MSAKIKIAISLALAAVNLPAVARACSVCFSGDGDDLTHAFNWSIGFLLAAPYVIVGTIAGYLLIAYRRAAAQRAVDEQGAMNGLIWTQEENPK